MDHLPGYINLYNSGELLKRVGNANKHLQECNLCPHNCNVNRKEKLGFCRATDKVVISSYGPHHGEESVLVGTRGSGTIFFGYCNMRCVFCQNCELSFGGEGEIISNEKLAKIMLLMQTSYGCHNINLVSPTHFVPNILEAVYLAVREGLELPIVYNCGGYEREETLKLLEGVVDIYMPDFKYTFEEAAEEYSGVKIYPTAVKDALKEMDRQVGGIKADEDNIAYRGLLIRHLVMPGGIEDTKKVLEFVAEELSEDVLINLMDQYYPAHQAHKYEKISRRLTNEEYSEVWHYAKKLGLNLV